MAQELGFDGEVLVDYDQYRFVSLRAQEIYYVDLVKKNLFLERGISLDKLRKHFELSTKGCWHLDRYVLQLNLARQMSNWLESLCQPYRDDMASKLITIRGKVVDYGPELCKRVEVEILFSDTWMEPKILSIHLRYVVRSRGEKQKEEDGLREKGLKNTPTLAEIVVTIPNFMEDLLPRTIYYCILKVKSARLTLSSDLHGLLENRARKVEN
uniref:Uncharacterized protein n=1 Tax=Solanum tuberosum TaxID=4113 RepID=M1DSJ9_SOLTU